MIRKIKNISLIFIGFIISLCFVSVSFTNVFAEETYTVEINSTYFKKAVVSEVPITLSATVRNSKKQYVYDKDVVFSISNGTCAQIDDGKLTVNDSGDFTVKAALADDSSVFCTVDCVAYAATFSNAQIKSKIENITVYTQPIKLIGSVDVVLTGSVPSEAHKEMKFEIISGPAELYPTDYTTKNPYIKFIGEGTVVLRASSIFNPSVYAEKTIVVSDPEKNLVLSEEQEQTIEVKQIEDVNRNADNGGGCSCNSVVQSGNIILTVFAVVGIMIAFIVRKMFFVKR